MNAKELIERGIAQGVSRREIARRCNVSLGTIQNILLGDTEIKNSTLSKISRYFNVDIDGLKTPPAPEVTVTLRDILTLHEEIHKLASEIGEIKMRMLDAAKHKDVKLLGLVGGKGR